MKTAETRISNTQQKISEETQRLADISGGSYARQQEQFEEAQSEAHESRAKYDELQQDTTRVRQELEQAGKEVR